MTAEAQTKLPEGYTCGSCETFNRFPMYVYAHWREILVGKCEGCGEEHEVLCGQANPIKRSVRKNRRR